ncbi:phasin family protein [Parvibaculum sp.]|uniref:phasin family protein n=1 Tax=Parvibaculum sp. TaxID=2024848 RepID=UPI001B0C3E90|nr:phasin family protein [Parvibaculum sp.]MBO6634331.1 phasin family protein [Parvibaculum sp.]MBO6677584.1 phasin family protein [Parvibaculum sp.]MBO6684290.1 phasin family protein [Parvibaculum sp.]MBO6905835.1 phasin family protein [Parvibaculum sp.]
MNDISKEMFDAFAASAKAAADNAVLLNKELLEFGKTRIEIDASTAEAMLGAKSMSDLLALQRDFMVAAFEAYAEESGKLREMTMDMTNQMVGRISKPLAA